MTSLQLTLAVGWASTLMSVLLALAVAGFLHHRAGGETARKLPGAVAGDAAFGARDRLRFPDPALGLDGALDLAGPDGMDDSARRGHRRARVRLAADRRPGDEGSAFSAADDPRCAQPGACAGADRCGARDGLRAGAGVVQGGAAAGLPADPPADLRRAGVLAVGGGRGHRARAGQSADAGGAGGALVLRSRHHALLSRRRCSDAFAGRGAG